MQPLDEPDLDALAKKPAPNRLIQGVGLFVGVIALAMIAIPTVETIARRFFSTQFPLGILLVQHFTVWIGFLGALLATLSNQHLALSVSSAVPARFRPLALFLNRGVSAAVCALLSAAAIIMVKVDFASARTLIFDIPVAWSEAVMPAALALMALRFAWGPTTSKTPWSYRAGALALAVAAFALALLGPSTTLTWVLAAILLVAFLSGAPIFVAMGGAAMLLFWSSGTPIAAVPNEAFRMASQATLPAIPLLTIAGYVLAEGGAAGRMVRAFKGTFGWLPGGIAVMVAVVCAIFTTLTGGSGVTILALGGLFYPMLKSQGYPEGFSLGLVTAAGSLGLLFPPSLPVLLYGVVAQVPPESLYIGGFLPGFLLLALVAGYAIWVGRKVPMVRPPFAAKTALLGLWGAKWDLGLPVVIIGSVFSGFATMVEAAALGCAYALFVEMLVFRTISPWRDLPRILTQAATLIGAVIILLGMALGLSSFLVDAQIPTALLELVTEHIKSPWAFLLLLNVGLLVLGSVLEIYAAITVLAPLIAPIGVAYGIDPVHLGVVFLANLELGFLFPPMGINLFLASTRFQKPLTGMYRHTAPFLAILAVGVLLVTYFPLMTTGVVQLFGR